MFICINGKVWLFVIFWEDNFCYVVILCFVVEKNLKRIENKYFELL